LAKATDREKPLCLNTISKCLKHDFRRSYKRVNKRNPTQTRPEEKSRILLALGLQLSLEDNGVYTVFIDEFKYSSRCTQFYSWGKIGKTSNIITPVSGFDCSFMIAYSHCKIHGVMAVKSNFNAS
jgi:hypothetical protein